MDEANALSLENFETYSGILHIDTKVVYTLLPLLQVSGVGFKVSGVRKKDLKPEH